MLLSGTVKHGRFHGRKVVQLFMRIMPISVNFEIQVQNFKWNRSRPIGLQYHLILNFVTDRYTQSYTKMSEFVSLQNPTVSLSKIQQDRKNNGLQYFENSPNWITTLRLREKDNLIFYRQLSRNLVAVELLQNRTVLELEGMFRT